MSHFNTNGIDIVTAPSSIHAPTAALCFSFRKRWSRIDWRSIASVDVDRIAREMDIQALQSNIVNITFCNVDLEEFHDVDANFIKLFRLAQFIIEYLLHSQQYLSDHRAQLEQKIEVIQQDLAKAQDELSSKAEEVKVLKKENRKRKKVVEAYKDLLNSGATGLHTVYAYLCPVCTREFLSAQYLQSHLCRRHPDHLLQDQKESTSFTHDDAMEKRLFEQMMEHLHVNEKHLRDEMEKKEKELLEAQAKEFKDWKRTEQEKMKMEMQEFKEPVLADLRNILQVKVELEEGAEELVQDGSRQLAEKTRSEVTEIKKQLESQVQEMQSALKKQEKIWKRRMLKLGATYQDQLKDSMGKLQTLEQSLHECTQQTDLSHQQALLSRQLTSFHQKLKQHEEQLISQQLQLSSLRSRESSPMPTGIPETSPAKTGGSESSTESENDDEVDSPEFYTPWKHRPDIQTLYDHQPEVLENIKQESLVILNDALVQRGFSKSAKGISTSQLKEKMENLGQERQQRVHAHYNFTSHREKLSEKLQNVMAENFVQKEAKLRLQKTKDLPSLAVSSKNASKPPKPHSTNKKALQHVPLEATMPSTSIVHPTHSNPKLPARETIQVKSMDSSYSSEAEDALSVESSEVFSESDEQVIVSSDKHTGGDKDSGMIKPAYPHGDNEDSQRESENESIEELAAHLFVGASSTPVKKADFTVKQSTEVRKEGSSPVKVESDDSWDVSELSNPSVPVKSKQTVKVSAVSSSDNPSKQIPQSALTSVTLDDLEDSDFSDWTS